jgi:hypothetical protein
VAADDTQAAFAKAAAADGVMLAPDSFDWLCEQGHVGLERVAMQRRDPSLRVPVTAAVQTLAAIFARLRGDETVLDASRDNLLLPIDLVHAPSGTLIQIDDRMHFTTHRLTALDLYPPDAALGFDAAEHRALCRRLAPETDPLARGLPAKAFGFGGVGRQRAYHDALFDLAAPAMGHPAVIRIVDLEGDGKAAYRRHRDALRALAGDAGAAPPASGRHAGPR